MTFFFVRDSRRRYRYFSTEPAHPIRVNFSRPRQAWETAKTKLLQILPSRLLRQEQAFERGLTWKGGPLRILYGGAETPEHIARHFERFLRQEKLRHILLLTGEAVLMPITWVAALLPGPNILFYVLALLVLLQIAALRGISRTLRLERELTPDPVLTEWEEAVAARDEARYPGLLDRLERAHGLTAVRKVLWPSPRPPRRPVDKAPPDALC